MPSILVRNQEQSHDSAHRNLVVVGLAVQREMIRIDLDVVAATGICFVFRRVHKSQNRYIIWMIKRIKKYSRMLRIVSEQGKKLVPTGVSCTESAREKL